MGLLRRFSGMVPRRLSGCSSIANVSRSFVSTKNIDTREKSSSAFSLKEAEEEKPLPQPPQKGDCCMSGCFNCVWLMYTEDLIRHFDGDKGAAGEELFPLIDQIEDYSVKEFIKLELRLRGKMLKPKK